MRWAGDRAPTCAGVPRAPAARRSCAGTASAPAQALGAPYPKGQARPRLCELGQHAARRHCIVCEFMGLDRLCAARCMRWLVWWGRDEGRVGGGDVVRRSPHAHGRVQGGVRAGRQEATPRPCPIGSANGRVEPVPRRTLNVPRDGGRLVHVLVPQDQLRHRRGAGWEGWGIRVRMGRRMGWRPSAPAGATGAQRGTVARQPLGARAPASRPPPLLAHPRLDEGLLGGHGHAAQLGLVDHNQVHHILGLGWLCGVWSGAERKVLAKGVPMVFSPSNQVLIDFAAVWRRRGASR